MPASPRRGIWSFPKGPFGNRDRRQRLRSLTFMTYVIGSACVDVMDKSCVQECPADCIYEGARMMYINPDECVDCGACKLICRMDAICWEGDLPDDEQQHREDNAAFPPDPAGPECSARLARWCCRGRPNRRRHAIGRGYDSPAADTRSLMPLTPPLGTASVYSRARRRRPTTTSFGGGVLALAYEHYRWWMSVRGED